MNIQLIQLISTKVLYTHFIPVFDDIQAQIFLQLANNFFPPYLKHFFVKIPLVNVGRSHCHLKTVFNIY